MARSSQVVVLALEGIDVSDSVSGRLRLCLVIEATVLFKVIPVNSGESLGNDRVADNRSLIYEAFRSENILFVAVEPINCGLACLRDHKLLQNQVYSSPTFDHV